MSTEHGTQDPGEGEKGPTPEQLNIRLRDFYGNAFPKYEFLDRGEHVSIEDINQTIQQMMPQIQADIREQRKQDAQFVKTHEEFLTKTVISPAFKGLLRHCFFGSLGSLRDFPVKGKPSENTPIDVLFASAPTSGTGMFQKDTAMQIEREVYEMRRHWLRALYTYQVVEYAGKYPGGIPEKSREEQHLQVMVQIEDEELTNLRNGFQQHYGEALIPPTEEH